jgi:hypothetical protein
MSVAATARRGIRTTSSSPSRHNSLSKPAVTARSGRSARSGCFP